MSRNITVTRQACQAADRKTHLSLIIGGIKPEGVGHTQKNKPPEVSPEIRAMGARVRQARETLGLDRSTLEQRAGLSTGRISTLEKGQRLSKLTAEVVLKISKELGVSAGWLLTGEGEMFTAGTRKKAESA